MNNLIVLNQNDNVGVSQFIIPEKTKIEGHDISTIDPIPFGHKVCLKSINKGDPIIKYDQIIILTFENDEEAETLFTAPFKLLLIVVFFVEAPISSHLEDLLSLVSFSSFNFSYMVCKDTSGINHTVSLTVIFLFRGKTFLIP